MNEVSKFCGAWAARLTSRFLPLSFLTAMVNSKLDLAVPRRLGRRGSTDSFAGRFLAKETTIGRLTSASLPFALTVSVSLAVALAGTSMRSWSDTLPLVGGIAAATGCPPPSRLTCQPDGSPWTERSSISGGRPQFCSFRLTVEVAPGRMVTEGKSAIRKIPLTPSGASSAGPRPRRPPTTALSSSPGGMERLPEDDGFVRDFPRLPSTGAGPPERRSPAADYDKSAQVWGYPLRWLTGQWADFATSGPQSLASVSGASVLCCSPSKESPSTISRTISPSGVTSITARLV